MERRGLAPERFVGQVDPMLICGKCRMVAKEPVTCSACYAAFCVLCTSQQKCGVCSGNRFEPLSGFALKMYNSLQILCKCQRLVPLCDLETHERQCQGQDQDLARLGRIIAELTTENAKLKKENLGLKQELASVKAKIPSSVPQISAPEHEKEEIQPKKRSDPPVPKPKPPVSKVDEHKESDQNKPPTALATLAATTIQKAFRQKKAREIRAALQEKRQERMQHTGFKQKRNEAMAGLKNAQQAVQKLGTPWADQK